MSDEEAETRKMACCIVENIADRAAAVGHMMFTDAESFINCAQQIEHYITDGQDVAIVISDSGLSKCVRGGDRHGVDGR